MSDINAAAKRLQATLPYDVAELVRHRHFSNLKESFGICLCSNIYVQRRIIKRNQKANNENRMLDFQKLFPILSSVTDAQVKKVHHTFLVEK